jgi:hypothetical protein
MRSIQWKGVVVDRVDPVPVAIVCEEPGQVPKRPARVLARLRRAADGAEVAHAIDPPRPTLAFERFLEREVRVEGVVVLERWRLVQDLVGPLDHRHGLSFLSCSAGPPGATDK